MVKSSLIAALTVTLAVAYSADASAKKRRKNKKPVVALFLSAKNKPDPKLYGKLLNELTKTASKSKPMKVLYGKSLKRVIRGNPSKAINKCGSNVACISKLGQKARAEVVIYGRVSPAGGGIKAQMLVVDVASQSISERLALSLTSTGQIGTEIAANLDKLFPVGGTAGAAEEELPLDMILGGGDAVADAGDTTEATDTGETGGGGGGELPLDFTIEEPDDTTTTTTTTAAAEPEPEEPVGGLELEPALPPPVEPATEIAAVSPELATTTETESSGGGSRALTYTGIGVAGLGVAALGVGGYFGMASSSTVDSIEYGPGGTTQLEAVDIEKDANDQAGLANLMFGVGGGLVAVGAILVALDLFVLDGGGTPETSVSVGDGSAAANFTWRF